MVSVTLILSALFGCTFNLRFVDMVNYQSYNYVVERDDLLEISPWN